MLPGAMTFVGASKIHVRSIRVLIPSLSHLSFVRNAFSGIPTLVKENMSKEDTLKASLTSDIL